MRDPKLHAPTLAYLLGLRDGEYAFDKLRELASNPGRPDLSQAERALAQRGEPLADMAVASFGYDADAVRTVFDRGLSPCHRVAVLGNRYVRATGWAGTVLDLEQAAALLASADPDELDALLSNPRITPEGLADVFTRRGPALSIPDMAWPGIFRSLSENSAIGELFDARRIYPSAAVRAQMHEALFYLINTIPPTAELAEPLGLLLSAWNDSRSPASLYEKSDINALVVHWHPNVACDATADPRFKVVMLLAILCSCDANYLRQSTFPSVRAAGMAAAEINDIADMQRMMSEEASTFFAGMPFNRCLYETPLFGTEFVSLASGRDESALAIYLERRATFDKLWRLDRPLVARDLDRIRAAMVAAVKPGVVATEASLAKSMQDSARREAPVGKDRYSPYTTWRNIALAAGVIIIFLLLAQLFELHPGIP